MQSLNGGAGSPYGCKARVQADSSQSPNDIYDHTLSLQLETMQAQLQEQLMVMRRELESGFREELKLQLSAQEVRLNALLASGFRGQRMPTPTAPSSPGEPSVSCEAEARCSREAPRGAIEMSADDAGQQKAANFMQKFAKDEIFGRASSRVDGKAAPKAKLQIDKFCLVLHPFSTGRLVWDAVGICLILVMACTLPYRLAFLSAEWSLGWAIFDLLVDLFFLFDLMLNFRTAYYEDGQLVTTSKAIAINYVRGWFGLDLISSFPFDWFVTGLSLSAPESTESYDGSGYGGLLDLLRIFKALRLLRLLRFTRFFRYFAKWQDDYFPTVNTNYVWLLKVALVMVIFSHWNGCIQFLITSLEGFPGDSWVARSGVVWLTPFEQYTWSFFNSVSQMLAISTGIIPPESTTDIWVCLVSMVLGAVVNGVFVASLTAAIANSGAAAREYRSKLDMVNQYMRHAQLPRSTRSKLRAYYDLCFPNRRCFNERSILSELSHPLQEEVTLHLCSQVLATLQVVQGAEPGLAGAVTRALVRVAFVANDIIVRAGETAEAMYFISRGEVEVLKENAEVLTTLGPSSFFGEMALLSDMGKALATIRVLVFCEGYELSRPAYENLVRNFPSFKRYLEAVARLRLQATPGQKAHPLAAKAKAKRFSLCAAGGLIPGASASGSRRLSAGKMRKIACAPVKEREMNPVP